MICALAARALGRPRSRQLLLHDATAQYHGESSRAPPRRGAPAARQDAPGGGAPLDLRAFEGVSLENVQSRLRLAIDEELEEKVAAVRASIAEDETARDALLEQRAALCARLARLDDGLVRQRARCAELDASIGELEVAVAGLGQSSETLLGALLQTQGAGAATSSRRSAHASEQRPL